jgi:hypothetical protein
MRNRFAGNCRDCGRHVAEGAGYFHKEPRGTWPKWSVRCISCVAAGKQARGAPQSFGQQAALSAARSEGQ